MQEDINGTLFPSENDHHLSNELKKIMPGNYVHSLRRKVLEQISQTEMLMIKKGVSYCDSG